LNVETSIDIGDGYKPCRKERKKRKKLIPNLLRRLRKTLGLDSGFEEIRGRARPVSNADKLIYAIVNNENSHIGAFPMGPAGDPLVEYKQIRQAYESIMESIRDPEDSYFRARIDRCLQTTDAN
jgi:hypothetical protein